MAFFKILAFQNPVFKIFSDFKILAFQNFELNILAFFKILAFQNPEFKIMAEVVLGAYLVPFCRYCFYLSIKAAASFEGPVGTQYYLEVINSISKHDVIGSYDEVKRPEWSRHSQSAEEDSELRYVLLCKGEVIYVDEGLSSHLWDRISVPCALCIRSALRMRTSACCVKAF